MSLNKIVKELRNKYRDKLSVFGNPRLTKWFYEVGEQEYNRDFRRFYSKIDLMN